MIEFRSNHDGLNQWVTNHLAAAAGTRVETFLAMRADHVDFEIVYDKWHLEAIWDTVVSLSHTVSLCV